VSSSTLLVVFAGMAPATLDSNPSSPSDFAWSAGDVTLALGAA